MAEFNSTAMAAKQWIWLQNTHTKLYTANYKKNEYTNIKLYNDNTACLTSITTGKLRASIRQVGVPYFWLKKIIELREAEIGYFRTKKMVAEGFTKALDKTKHELFVAMLSMY